MQIPPVNDRIGITEPGPEIIPKRDIADFLGGDRIHEAQFLDIDSRAARRLSHPEMIKGMKGIRPELNTSPDFSKP